MKVEAKVKNSVADQDDENRIAPAGFGVNGGNLASIRRATAVNIIDAWQGMARGTRTYGRGDQTMRHWR